MRRKPTTVMATCHPLRRAVDGTHCKHCLPRTLTLEQATGPAPSECPHCHARWPMWHGDAMAKHCVACSQLWERPLAVVG